MAVKRKRLDPIHPGEILLEDFMKPLGISINRLARDIVVPPGQVNDAQGCANVAGGWTPGATAIVNGKRAITADTALRLGKYFGVSPQTWMGLQAEYELRVAQRDIGAEVDRRVQRRAA